MYRGKIKTTKPTTQNGNCNDKKWVSMPDGVASGMQTWWGKKDYCKRCEVDNNNTTGLATGGYFPVTLTTNPPYWNYTTNGSSYCHCCKNYEDGGGEIPPTYNPSSNGSYGFTKNYDGRIRGGIKTKEYYTNPNISRQNPINQIVNTNTMRNTNRFIPHPLDVLKQPRIMGQEVFDPVSKTWKIDDLRPRGLYGGKWACWGRCKVVKFGWRNNIKCPCNKNTQGGCVCDGCLGGASC